MRQKSSAEIPQTYREYREYYASCTARDGGLPVIRSDPAYLAYPAYPAYSSFFCNFSVARLTKYLHHGIFSEKLEN